MTFKIETPEQLESLQIEWDELKAKKQKLNNAISNLDRKKFKIEQKLGDLETRAWFSDYVLQYGKWVSKENMRKNPLLKLTLEDINTLRNWSSQLKLRFVKRELTNEDLESMPLLLAEHYHNYKRAAEENNMKEVCILVGELREIIPDQLL